MTIRQKKVQASIYKINKYYGIMSNMMTMANDAVW